MTPFYTVKPFPKYKSHCHDAPVGVWQPDDPRGKYFCTECRDPCIPRQKKEKK